LQEILNYFFFALNIIIFTTVAFLGLVHIVQYFNQGAAFINKDLQQKASLPLYDILLDYNHRDIDHWYSWLTMQSDFKKQKALNMLIAYLSEPIEYKGLITKDILRILPKFKCESLFEFLADFSDSALNNWRKNKSIASFYEQSLLSLLKLNPMDASAHILSNLQTIKGDPSREVASKYMISALSKIQSLPELQNAYKEIILDETFNIDFRFETLSLLLANNEENYPTVISSLLREMVNDSVKNFSLFNYCLNAIFESKKLDDNDIQDVLVACFSEHELEGESTRSLLRFLEDRDFYISQKLMFKLLNAVNPKNYKSIKNALIERLDLSASEYKLINEEEAVVDNFNELNSSTYDYQLFKFPEMIQCDSYLEDELREISSVIENEAKSCLKIIYGKSKLEKFYLIRIIASRMKRPLLVIDMENILDYRTSLGMLEHSLAQDPNKIVFIKNFKTLIVQMGQARNRKNAMRVFSMMKKYITYSRGNLIACIEDKLEYLMDYNEAFKNFFDEYGSLFIHSYTFDVPHIEKKKTIFREMIAKVDGSRTFDLNSFDELEKIVRDFSHFEYMNYLYRFFHDSLLTHKKILSVKKYTHLLKEKPLFDKKKPLLKLDYVS
jgi:hypothetical protein